MANRSPQVPAASRGRRGRSTPSSTRTPAANRSLRAKPSEAGAKGRFGLGSSLGPSTFGRSSSAGRKTSGRTTAGRGTTAGRSSSTARTSRSGRTTTRSLSRRQQPQQSGMGKALSALTGAMGSSSSAKTSSRGGKAGGVALLAGAAGLAFKNRDKLMGMARGNSQREDVPSGTVYGSGTATGVQVDTGAPVSAIGTVEGHVPGSDTIDEPTSTQQQSD